MVEPGARPENGIDASSYWRVWTLDEILRSEPIESVDDLAIEGLTEAEADAFVRALAEARSGGDS